MKYLNYSGAITGFVGVVSAIIMAIMTTDLLLVPILSDLVFCFVMLAMITRPTATSFYFLYEELTSTRPRPQSSSSSASSAILDLDSSIYPDKPSLYSSSLDVLPLCTNSSHHG
jgi:hypothetical protein